MAQKTVFTEFFRIGPFPALDAPYASKPGDTPKYSVKALFPQNGITKPTGQPTSGVATIIAALNEVCMAEFKVDYNTLLQHHLAYGIQYPPKFIDGNQDWQKDENKNPIIGQARPESASMWCISFKSADPVDLVAPNGKENVSAAQMSAGFWARAEISVDAYTNKQNQRVLSIKLLNLQLCFEDEKLASGGNQKQAGTAAFANMAVPNTNVQPAFNGVPAPAAGVPGAVPAGVPGMPAPGVAPGMVPGAGVPGMPVHQQATSPGMVPGMVSPVPGVPPSVPGMVPTGMVPGMPAPGVAPGYAVPGAMVPGVPAAAPAIAPPPPAAAAPAVNVHDRVIMKPGEHPLVNYTQQGWTPELLVQHGKADWNYNYVG